jgi:V8-like Glu-specific endopeptidase
MVRRIRVMPARNGETSSPPPPFPWIEVGQENLRVHQRWLNNGDLNFDYGAILLPANPPVGATVGFLPVNSFSDQQLMNATATLSGYPDNVPDGTQWRETNPIRQVTPTRLFYDIFTFGGQSGSPLFFANNAGQVACAIHNFGDQPFNSGIRITPQVEAQLNAWISESQ